MMKLITKMTVQAASILLFLSSFLLFVACEEDIENQIAFEEGEESAFQSEEMVETAFDAIESITNAAIKEAEANSGGRIAESSDPELVCALVSFEGTRDAGRLEIDFGEGCEGPDGSIRKGIIVVKYEGRWIEKNAKVYTVLQNFYLNDLQIEGTRIVTNVSASLESITLNVEIVGGKVIWPDGTFLSRESSRTHTWKFGQSLDEFELHVEGEASGNTRLGVEYLSKILQPLIFKSSCRGNTIYLPVSGVKSITITEKRKITIDYGNMDCDKKFMISIGEQRMEGSI